MLIVQLELFLYTVYSSKEAQQGLQSSMFFQIGHSTCGDSCDLFHHICFKVEGSELSRPHSGGIVSWAWDSHSLITISGQRLTQLTEKRITKSVRKAQSFRAKFIEDRDQVLS